MIRVLKASRFIKKNEDERSLSFSLLSLIKFSMMALFGGHWLACAWAVIGLMERESGNDNWITVLLDTNQDGLLLSSENPNHFIIYSASFYYATMTISSSGYGDITPQSTTERWICICIMLCGSALWAYVIGNASGIVATMNRDGILFHQSMDDLNAYLHDQKYPDDLQRKLRSYFHETRHLMQTKRNQELLEELSPMLRDAVAVRSATWVKSVRWCDGISKYLIANLVQSMYASVYCPAERMPSMNHLGVISKGVASKQGQVLVKGGSYGTDIVLQSTFLKQKAPAQAITHVELLSINRSDLLDVLLRFPKDNRNIRRYALRLALRRAMILISTFAKCGWKFSIGETQIPFVSPLTLNQRIGKKYEKYVHKLHPQLSIKLPETDIDQLVLSTEKQEHEEGYTTGLLVSPHLSKKKSSLEHQKLEKGLLEIQIDLIDMNCNIKRCSDALDRLIKGLNAQSNLSSLEAKEQLQEGNKNIFSNE